MVTGPALLLADEPTAQLDHAAGNAAIAALISWSRSSGSALVVATHDPAVAEAFDEVWHMNRGRFTGASPEREL